jgi:hypothetical protein
VASQQDFFSSLFLFGCGNLALCKLDMAFGRCHMPLTSMHAVIAMLWRSLKGVHGKM